MNDEVKINIKNMISRDHVQTWKFFPLFLKKCSIFNRILLKYYKFHVILGRLICMCGGWGWPTAWRPVAGWILNNRKASLNTVKEAFLSWPGSEVVWNFLPNRVDSNSANKHATEMHTTMLFCKWYLYVVRHREWLFNELHYFYRL